MENFKKTLIIANPTAQSGAGEAAARQAEKLIRKAAGEGPDVVRTRHAGHGTELAARMGASYDLVIALGGDGIIHEVVNGLMRLLREDRPMLGIIPVGSGNDYAKTLHMSEKVDQAIAQILAGKAVAADLGCCNGEYFTETISFGLDAAIALGTVERRKKTGGHGTMLYLQEGIDQLFRHLNTYDFKLEILEGPDEDLGVHEGKGILLAVQNGITYGGGFAVCPEASIQDGMLDICIARGPLNPLYATKIFLSAKNGHHVGAKPIEMHRASRLRLEFDRRPPCQIDGEPHIADAYEISVEPAALRVIVG